MAFVFALGSFAILGSSARWLYGGVQALNTLRGHSLEDLGDADALSRLKLPAAPRATTGPTRSVTFRLLAPSAQAVSVAGSFDDFDALRHPLARGADGFWEGTLDLPPGTHEYRFDVDGRWELDPANPDRTPAPDECSLVQVSP